MAEELEKTCENCEYEHEDMEGTHCRHCIHNAEEHFEPKINYEKEIRNKAIDELLNYAETHSFYIRDRAEEIPVVSISMLKVLAEQMKGGAE